MGAAYTPETWDEWTAEMRAKHNNGNGHGKSLNVEAQPLSLDVEGRLLPTPTTRDQKGENQRRDDTCLTGALLPTPTAMDAKSSGAAGYGSGHDGTTLTDATVRQPDRWGEYEQAIRRWESLTRPAPEPTKPNSKGNPKLSDEFDEWLMGYPKGWITDVPDITWNEVLKACGNGVVWQQGAAALRWLLNLPPLERTTTRALANGGGSPLPEEDS
jgi:DNA (cytosine-5)-methyltransferase 1